MKFIMMLLIILGIFYITSEILKPKVYYGNCAACLSKLSEDNLIEVAKFQLCNNCYEKLLIDKEIVLSDHFEITKGKKIKLIEGV